jgi:phage tail sheath protein FI
VEGARRHRRRAHRCHRPPVPTSPISKTEIPNTQGINCQRQFRVYGEVVWGARTLQGADAAGSQWKYVPIRRFAFFLESSLHEGTQWVVFDPNDETLRGQIRLNVGSFMQGLFLQGAFRGTRPRRPTL